MLKYILVLFQLFFFTTCAKPVENNEITDKPQLKNEVDFWLTKANQTVKLEKQTAILSFGTTVNMYPTIEINSTSEFQTIDGFGFALTGGSAQVINMLAGPKKRELLLNLFGADSNSISISYLRLSIGASDLNNFPFSYNDIPVGQTDLNLDFFCLGPDTIDVIPLLKEILLINPKISIIATPWSAPVWMKDNNSFIGGRLQPKYYDVYARYFVKYIQKMQELGITIHAITPQNEPLHDGNNPSMLMYADEQADFIINHLGPAFRAANITTKIVIYDHNCDKPEYPISILRNPAARQFIDGTAFHLYAGDISAMSQVHNAFPQQNLYFTEQFTSSHGKFDEDLRWHLRNVIIGSMRNWSRNALLWNLASDASYGPHTIGGCTICKGAITIVSNLAYTKNVGYYIIGHASKFVPPGSRRIASNFAGNIINVAFKTPEGRKVLIVLNDSNSFELFNVKYNDKWFTSSLHGGSVATFIW